MTLLTNEVSSYLQSLIHPLDSICAELEQIAQDRFIPIMDPDTAALIRVLGLAYSPKLILEVGTAIGYSTYVMARSTPARIVTLEIDDQRYQEATSLFERVGVAERVMALKGDALELLPQLNDLVAPEWMQQADDSEGTFDWIFIDAAKGQYPKFLELVLPRLAPKGLLFSDNILFQGLVSGPVNVKHKLRTLVTRLREYNLLLAEHPNLETSFLPVGDGLAISTHRNVSKD